jgi:hypothetical protein
LNRLLFQTQVYLEKKLIHRLHVLNPLTNTDIIGNVLYFMVMGKSKKSTAQSPVSVEYALVVPPTPTVSKVPPLTDIVQLNISLHNASKDGVPAIGVSTSVPTQKTWTLSGPVSEQVEAKEFEALSSPLPPAAEMSFQSSTTSNATATSLKRQSVPGKNKTVDDLEANRASTTSHENLIIDKFPQRKPGLKITTKFKSEDDGPQTAGIIGVGTKQSISPLSINFPKSAYPAMDGFGGRNSSIVVGLKGRRTTLVPKGVVSQRGERINDSEVGQVVPAETNSRRRQISYMNSVQNSKASIEQWKESLSAAIEADSEYKKMSVGGVTASKEEWFYDAVLIATDSDFLETSRIRQMFRDNAVNPSDAVLFEMPPYTGEDPQIRARINDDLVCDFCLPTEAQLRHRSPWVRFFHEYKCYGFILLLTAGILGFIWYLAMASKKE